MSKPRNPSPYIAITHKGRREITFYWLPQELEPEEIIEVTESWIRNEICKRGIICELKYIANQNL